MPGSSGDGMDGLRRLGKDVRRPATPGPDPAGDPGRHRPRHARSRSSLTWGSRTTAPPRPRLLRRRWPRRSLITLNVLTALALMGAGAAYGYVQWRLGQIHRIHVAGLHSAKKQPGSNLPPFTLLVIGTDSRAIAGGGGQFGGTSAVQGQRSDSIILMRVVPKTRAIALLSIPRDTLVPIPGYGTTRINTAFNTGNPSLLSTVLDQDFGIQVNHVAIFNFDTFRSVANAVGGVEQYFPAPAKDAFSLLNVPQAGCTNLSGDQALGFVRSREYQYYLNGQWNYQLYPESDLARIQRQQSFLRDLVHKAKQVAPTNPIALNNIIGGVTKNLTLDSGFSNSLIISLADDFKSANLSTIPSYTYPTVNSTAVPGALDPLTAQGQAVIQQWLDVGQAPPSPASETNPHRHPVITESPSSIAISIQNGSGIGGQASRAGQDLSGLGYRTTVSGDAPSFGLTITQIAYAPDSLAAAKQVQSQLVGNSTLVEDSGLTPTPYNLLIVTGKDYSGVITPSGQVSSATTVPQATTTTVGSPAISGAPSVNPDSSSIWNGVYIPPGLSPGQIPKTCGE